MVGPLHNQRLQATPKVAVRVAIQPNTPVAANMQRAEIARMAQAIDRENKEIERLKVIYLQAAVSQYNKGQDLSGILAAAKNLSAQKGRVAPTPVALANIAKTDIRAAAYAGSSHVLAMLVDLFQADKLRGKKERFQGMLAVARAIVGKLPPKMRAEFNSKIANIEQMAKMADSTGNAAYLDGALNQLIDLMKDANKLATSADFFKTFMASVRAKIAGLPPQVRAKVEAVLDKIQQLFEGASSEGEMTAALELLGKVSQIVDKMLLMVAFGLPGGVAEALEELKQAEAAIPAIVATFGNDEAVISQQAKDAIGGGVVEREVAGAKAGQKIKVTVTVSAKAPVPSATEKKAEAEANDARKLAGKLLGVDVELLSSLDPVLMQLGIAH